MTVARLLVGHRLLALVVSLFIVHGSGAAFAATSDLPVLMVTDFRNNTGSSDYDALGKGLADMVLTDLSAGGAVRVVERSRLNEVLAEQDLQQTARFDSATTQRLGQLVGASHVVTGGIVGLEPMIRIDMRLVTIASGEVLVSEQVTGERNRFFELEEALVTAFLTGLSLSTAGPPPTSNVADVQTVTTYGIALDQSDRGDLEGASRTLGSVVAKEPEFKLAQERYTEVMRRLYEARARRNSALSELSKELQKRVDQELRGVRVEDLTSRQTDRYFGYRILAGSLFLGRLAEMLLKDPDSFSDDKVLLPPDKRDEGVQLMRDFAGNTETYIGEMRRWSAAHPEEKYPEFDGELDDADEALAERAGLGDAGEWTFADPTGVAQDLVEFIFQGEPPFFGDIDFDLETPLSKLDRAWYSRGYYWLGQALAFAEEIEDQDNRQKEVCKTLDLWAEVLLEEGRDAEAIGRWQMILDRFPTYEDYDDIEQKIRKALGIED